MAEVQHIRAAAAPPEPPQRSPEREKLADAISRLRSAEAYAARVAEAIRRKSDELYEANRAVDRAHDVVKDARGDDSRWLVEAVINGSSPVHAAERDLAALTATRDAHREQVEVLRQEEARADTAVRRCQEAMRYRRDQAYHADPAVAQRRRDLEDAQAVVLRRQRAMRPDFDALRAGLETDPDAKLAPEN